MAIDEINNDALTATEETVPDGTVTVNFNTMRASSMELGHIGEHNATTLEVTWTNSDERVASYRVAFQTGGKSVLSDSYYSMPIEVALWQQLTLNPRMSIQIIAYDSEGDYIGKSEKFSGFYFAPSVQSNEAAADTDQHDIGAELSRVETTVADHEERIDALEAKTEVYTINGTKTGYEWFNLYKTAVLKYKGNEIIGAKYDSSSKVATFYFYENGILGEGYFRITVDASKSIGEDLTPQGNIHLHDNKAVIDKFSYEDGKLLYDGEEIGGGGAVEDVQDADGNSLVSDGIAVIPTGEMLEIVESAEQGVVISKYSRSEIYDLYAEGKALCCQGFPISTVVRGDNYYLYFISGGYNDTPYLSRREVKSNKTITTAQLVGYFTEREYTAAKDTKLSGIATGAEVNVIDSIKDSNGNPLTVTSKSVTLPDAPVSDVQDSSGTSLVSNGVATIPAPTIPVTDVQDSNGNSLVTSGVAQIPAIPDISGKEDTANKVTSLSSSSTDTEYPSAKCVYDELQNIPSMPSGTNAGDILVWDGSAWVAQKPSRLPSGYQEVEYIGSTGTQYIDTGYAPKTTTEWELIWKAVSPAPSGDLSIRNGRHGGGDGQRMSISLISTGTSAETDEFAIGQIKAQNFKLYSGVNAFKAKNKVRLDASNMNVDYNDGYYSTTISGSLTFSSNATLYLMARNVAPSPDGFGIQYIYAHKIWENGTRVQDFVPCYRKADGVIGMYDLVTDTFFTNSGTGTFTKGADVN